MWITYFYLVQFNRSGTYVSINEASPVFLHKYSKPAYTLLNKNRSNICYIPILAIYRHSIISRQYWPPISYTNLHRPNAGCRCRSNIDMLSITSPQISILPHYRHLISSQYRRCRTNFDKILSLSSAQISIWNTNITYQY